MSVCCDRSNCGPLTLFSQIYEQMPNQKGTTLYAVQKKFQAVFGFTFPVFHGRGLLNCWSFRPTPCALADIGFQTTLA